MPAPKIAHAEPEAHAEPAWSRLQVDGGVADAVWGFARTGAGVLQLGLQNPDMLVLAARAVGPRGWAAGFDEDAFRLSAAQQRILATGCANTQLYGPEIRGTPDASARTTVDAVVAAVGASPQVVLLEQGNEPGFAAHLAKRFNPPPALIGWFEALQPDEQQELADCGYVAFDLAPRRVVELGLSNASLHGLLALSPGELPGTLTAYLAPRTYHARLSPEDFAPDGAGGWRLTEALPLPAGRFAIAAVLRGAETAKIELEAFSGGRRLQAVETGPGAGADAAWIYINLQAPAPVRFRFAASPDLSDWSGLDVWRIASTAL